MNERTFTADEVDAMIARAVAKATQPAPVQEPDDSLFRFRVRVHLANRYHYSHREFCEKLEGLMHETPPAAQRQPLTDEQIMECITRIDPAVAYLPKALKQLARAVEQAHGIGSKA